MNPIKCHDSIILLYTFFEIYIYIYIYLHKNVHSEMWFILPLQRSESHNSFDA